MPRDFKLEKLYREMDRIVGSFPIAEYMCELLDIDPTSMPRRKLHRRVLQTWGWRMPRGVIRERRDGKPGLEANKSEIARELARIVDDKTLWDRRKKRGEPFT